MGSIVGGVASLASGSPSAPQANEATQISNAQDTYKTATSDAAQTMQSAQALNAQSQGTLASVNGQETPAMQAVNNSANQNLSTYGSTFVPLQQQQAQQAQNYTSDKNVQQLQGQAVADSNSSTQAALANQRQSLASEGVDPASVHGSALTQQAAITGAAQNAGAANNSYLQTQATGSQLTNQANQLGLQVGAAGTQAAQAAAGIGSGIVSNENNTDNSNINNLTASNTYLTGATNANNSATNAANDQFNQQQTGYQDQVAASAAKSAAIGGIASGVASMAMMRGGPVGQHRPSINFVPHGIPTYFNGGAITPRGAQATPIVPGTTDTKLIAATPGEFMLPKDVVEHMGHDKLHRLIDKQREDIAMRKGIPTARLSSAHTSQQGA